MSADWWNNPEKLSGNNKPSTSTAQKPSDNHKQPQQQQRYQKQPQPQPQTQPQANWWNNPTNVLPTKPKATYPPTNANPLQNYTQSSAPNNGKTSRYAPQTSTATSTPTETAKKNALNITTPYNKNTIQLEHKYAIGKKLGEGAFGVAYIATDRTSGKVCACKKVDKRKLVRPSDKDDIRNEITILQTLAGSGNNKCPGIVEFHEAIEDHQAFHIILELCSGGELFDRIIKRGRYTEKDAAGLCRVMLETIAYCHANGVVHRDLKPENFLFDCPEESARLKLTDFGLSTFVPGKQVKSYHRPSIQGRVGTPYYVAPEVLNNPTYDHKVDIYSLGCILYVLLSGRPVFEGKNEMEVLAKTQIGKYDLNSEPWPYISKEAKNVIRLMLTFDPKARPDAAELLKNPWIRKDGIASNSPIMDAVRKNMKQFYGMNKLKKQTLFLVAKNLQGDEFDEMQRVFKALDVHGTGEISIKDLKQAFTKMGRKIDEKEMEKIFATFDVDGNGMMDYIEFLMATTNIQKLQTPHNLHEAFRKMDKDGDGHLTVKEVYKVLKKNGVSKEAAEQIVKDADQDGDGTIDFEEFCDLMAENDSDIEEAANSVKSCSLWR